MHSASVTRQSSSAARNSWVTAAKVCSDSAANLILIQSCRARRGTGMTLINPCLRILVVFNHPRQVAVIMWVLWTWFWAWTDGCRQRHVLQQEEMAAALRKGNLFLYPFIIALLMWLLIIQLNTQCECITLYANIDIFVVHLQKVVLKQDMHILVFWNCWSRFQEEVLVVGAGLYCRETAGKRLKSICYIIMIFQKLLHC